MLNLHTPENMGRNNSYALISNTQRDFGILMPLPNTKCKIQNAHTSKTVKTTRDIMGEIAECSATVSEGFCVNEYMRIMQT
ncbi:hypothetical protein CEXT_613271 [Caerostris extrusa]|uniref:Uncharacterized protein n=1 Tax=Caerostris extrusa TaxID=172846 RepID=A0AAV4NIC9_CAEEX|nr:hypothetical protein CEXT_613271 [Caerostris extrusa]